LPSDERLVVTQEAANLRNAKLQESIAIIAAFNGPMKERHKIETAFNKTKKTFFEESIKDGFAAPEQARGLLRIVKQQFDLSVDRRGNRMLVMFVTLIVTPLSPPVPSWTRLCEALCVLDWPVRCVLCWPTSRPQCV